MTEQIPLVDYLVLGDEPHLVAWQCTACGARFLGRRNACAACSGTEFERVDVPTSGRLRTFTIVQFDAPGIDVPYVAGIVDCDGMTVAGNLVGVEPTPDNIRLNMPVELTTFVFDTDDNGTEAISFGFEPAKAE